MKKLAAHALSTLRWVLMVVTVPITLAAAVIVLAAAVLYDAARLLLGED